MHILELLVELIFILIKYQEKGHKFLAIYNFQTILIEMIDKRCKNIIFFFNFHIMTSVLFFYFLNYNLFLAPERPYILGFT